MTRLEVILAELETATSLDTPARELLARRIEHALSLRQEELQLIVMLGECRSQHFTRVVCLHGAALSKLVDAVGATVGLTRCECDECKRRPKP